MVWLRVENSYITICDVGSPEEFRAVKKLDRQTAYLIAGHEHSIPYREHRWDGRMHLLRYSEKGGGYRIPTGLLNDVVEVFPASRVEDCRRRPDPAEAMRYSWIGPSPRDYQQSAVDAVLQLVAANEPPRGLLQVPIRGGKTLIAAQILLHLGWRTTFVVESELLLHQTQKAFESYLQPLSIVAGSPWVGLCGGGRWDPGWVTVATVQGLLAHSQEALELLSRTDLLIIDEVHHMRADAWRKPLLASDSWGKIGLSATLFEDHDIPQERSTIWVRATTGPILYEISIDDLVTQGYLTQPYVLMYSITHANAPKKWRYGKTYQQLITEGLSRNSAIADLAEDAVLRGAPTLIDTGRTEQMRILHKMLEARNIPVANLHGKTPNKTRQRVLSDFRQGRIGVLIATILGEGVDVPELQVVINAEGGRARTSVIQRLRNLTRHEGKSKAIIIDFADQGQKHLQQQALDRLNQYAGISSFRVEWIEDESRPLTIPEHLLGPRQTELMP